MNRKLISKGELLIIVLVLAVAFIVHVIITRSPHENIYAIISVRNHPDIRLELAENAQFTLPQNPNIHFTVEGGSIAFTASDCPDQICVRMGFLNRPGQSAACLPNLVSLTIRGTARNDSIDTFLRSCVHSLKC